MDDCVNTGISHAFMANFVENGNTTTDVFVKICAILRCNIGDIMEMVPEKTDRKDSE